MDSYSRKAPDWLLERLAAGEMSEGQARELRASLETQGESARLAALAASNAEILAALPPGRVVPEIERRAKLAPSRAAARRMRPLLAFSLAATCAAGVAVFLANRGPDCPGGLTMGPHGPECIGIKGTKPWLRVHRKTKTGSEALSSSAPVRKGDTLQLGYLAAGKRFGVIASIDARGTVTLHLPESPGPAAPLQRGGEHALAHAYELDDSPGFERFVFVASDTPFATADVVRTLRKERALPAALTMFELTLRKETP
ncbi:MAG: hypothetical protein JXP73_21135 [Deltaproteobacteria bacterium]|nr:hypothetical protein [Deltaproteobacteria bacterium]